MLLRHISNFNYFSLALWIGNLNYVAKEMAVVVLAFIVFEICTNIYAVQFY